MTKNNSQNVIIKRRYFEYLKHADGKADSTIKSIKASIRRFEKYTKHKNFKTFDRKQAIRVQRTHRSSSFCGDTSHHRKSFETVLSMASASDRI